MSANAGVSPEVSRLLTGHASTEVRHVLRRSADHDQQTGAGVWNPSYGFGKVDVALALALV